MCCMGFDSNESVVFFIITCCQFKMISLQTYYYTFNSVLGQSILQSLLIHSFLNYIKG